LFCGKNRKARLITSAEEGIMDQVLVRIMPLIGADLLIESFVKRGVKG